MSLKTDVPVTSTDKDLLGRAHYAKAIARVILQPSSSDPVVVAINGPWGSGKSSFLNFLESNLIVLGERSEPAKPPIIVRFNPWHYSSIEQLIVIFFDELAEALGKAGNKKLAQFASQSLRALAKLAPLIYAPAQGALDHAADLLGKPAELARTKAKLNKTLGEIDQRVVVFVDDVDRLEPDTLQLLFRLVRMIADFRNVTYVLAYDRDVVERALEGVHGVNGASYLEKIVQTSFDLPKPDITRLHALLISELRSLSDTHGNSQLDDDRLNAFLRCVIREELNTLRKVNRFINGLHLTWGPVADEVNGTDFIIVEFLRTFFPAVYGAVYQNERDLIRASVHVSAESAGVNNLLTVISGAEPEAARRNVARTLLRLLFPALDATERRRANRRNHSQERRICAQEFFRCYFQLAVPSGQLPEATVGEFLSVVSSEAAYTMLRELSPSEQQQLFSRLLVRSDSFTRDQSSDLLGFILRDGDGLFDVQRHQPTAALQLFMDIAGLIDACLRRVVEGPSDIERIGAFVRERESLLAVVMLVAKIELIIRRNEGREEDHSVSSYFSQEDCDTLIQATIRRLAMEAETGEIWRSAGIGYLLNKLLDWNGESEIHTRLAAQVGSDRNLIHILKEVRLFVYPGMGDTEFIGFKKAVRRLFPEHEIPDRLATIVRENRELRQDGNKLFDELWP